MLTFFVVNMVFVSFLQERKTMKINYGPVMTYMYLTEARGSIYKVQDRLVIPRYLI